MKNINKKEKQFFPISLVIGLFDWILYLFFPFSVSIKYIAYATLLASFIGVGTGIKQWQSTKKILNIIGITLSILLLLWSIVVLIVLPYIDITFRG